MATHGKKFLFQMDEVDEIDGAINEPVIDQPRKGFTLYTFNRQPWIVKNKYERLEPLNVGAFGAVV